MNIEVKHKPGGGATVLAPLTAFLALVGSVSLIATGELNPMMLLPGIAMFPGYYRHFRGEPPAPQWAVAGLSVAAICVLLFDAVVISGDFFLAIAHMTLLFQSLKSFDLKEPWDYLQVFFMSMLQLIMASELTHSLVFGVVFTVFLVALVATSVVSHFVKEGTLRKVRARRPIAVISIISLLLTVLFFITIPRTGSSMWSRKSSSGIKTVGFSGSVDFGSFGSVLDDRTVVMRAEMSGVRLPLYWRGVALDHFDGTSWSSTFTGRSTIWKRKGLFKVSLKQHVTEQRIVIEPTDTDVIFGLGEPLSIKAGGKMIRTDGQGAIFHRAKKDRRFFYTVRSGPIEGMIVTNKSRYLQLPKGMQVVHALADEVAGEETDKLKQAKLIEDYLLSNFTYTLTTYPPPEGMNPIEDFLLNTKKGYCEHFSTAMVLMLRARGVPSRVVTGYMGGDENAFGGYVLVRQSNAHSWVEAAIDGVWQRFDPTPPNLSLGFPRIAMYVDSLRMKWYRYVVGYSFEDQSRLVGMLRLGINRTWNVPGVSKGARWFAVVAGLSVLTVSAWFFLRRTRRGAYGREAALYLRFRGRVKRLGGRVGQCSTPEEVLREALRLGFGEGTRRFIKMYEEVRFGGVKLADAQRRQYQRLSTLQPHSPTRGTKTHAV